MSSKNQENEVSPIYSWPPANVGEYLGGNGAGMASSFQQVQLSQVGGQLTTAQLPRAASGQVIRSYGTGTSSGFSYWLPSLGLGTDTGSAPHSALVVTGQKQASATTAGVYMGGDAGLQNYGIEINANSNVAASYIDLTYVTSDYRARIINDFNTGYFDTIYINSYIRQELAGRIILQGGGTNNYLDIHQGGYAVLNSTTNQIGLDATGIRMTNSGGNIKLLTSGAVQFNGNTGTTDQILKSTGSGSPPVWGGITTAMLPSVPFSNLPTDTAGKILVTNGVGVASSYKYWLPSLGLGTDTGSAPHSALVVTGQKQTSATTAGVYMGGDAGLQNYGIEINANSNVAASYIDLTYVTSDSRGRIIYDFNSNNFDIAAPNSYLRQSTTGNVTLQSASGYLSLLSTGINTLFASNTNITQDSTGISLTTTGGEFKVNSSGAFLSNGSAGSNNYFLVSQGASLPPLWKDPTAAIRSGISLPTTTTYTGPAIGSASYYTAYNIVLPTNYLYADITMYGGGGMGGSATSGGTGMYWAAGGASGSGIKVRLKNTMVAGGQTITVNCGGGANTNMVPVPSQGLDTYLSIPTSAYAAGGRGGANGGNAAFPLYVPGGGNGPVSINYGPMETIWEVAGQNGGMAFSADSVNFNPAGFSGAGANSVWGKGGPQVSIFGATTRNGTNATGFAAGGEGGLRMAVAGTSDGGFGSPGLAIVSIYYQ